MDGNVGSSGMSEKGSVRISFLIFLARGYVSVELRLRSHLRYMVAIEPLLAVCYPAAPRIRDIPTSVHLVVRGELVEGAEAGRRGITGERDFGRPGTCCEWAYAGLQVR